MPRGSAKRRSSALSATRKNSWTPAWPKPYVRITPVTEIASIPLDQPLAVVVVVALSFGLLTGPMATATRITLGLMHLSVGAVLIPVLPRMPRRV